jgi:hypothetical protein
VASHECGHALLAKRGSGLRGRVAVQESSAIGESTSAKIAAAPGQNCSSKLRS